ncbi:hypothetical protein, partial [Dielma fastidiosa]|uniref:hypothetical protein n=1 Tax=Dielma fastidiosa TaxID=1034346 RepID=UPI00356135DA
MNKYSSKAVKTAATVGMSLAMVLSNVAPVFAANTTKVCTIAKQYNAGDIIASKEFKGTMTADEVKAAIAAEINALARTKTETVSGKSVEYYLGYTIKNGTLKAVTTDLTTVDLTDDVTYGYYAANRYEIADTESGIVTDIAKDSPLAGSEVTVSVAERNAAAVKTEVTAYAEGLKGSSVTWDGSAVDYTMSITDTNGNGATGDLTITYQIEGSLESTANPTFDSKKVTVYSKVKTTFTDYNCKDVTTGTGLGITDRYTAKNVY